MMPGSGMQLLTKAALMQRKEYETKQAEEKRSQEEIFIGQLTDGGTTALLNQLILKLSGVMIKPVGQGHEDASASFTFSRSADETGLYHYLHNRRNFSSENVERMGIACGLITTLKKPELVINTVRASQEERHQAQRAILNEWCPPGDTPHTMSEDKAIPEWSISDTASSNKTTGQKIIAVFNFIEQLLHLRYYLALVETFIQVIDKLEETLVTFSNENVFTSQLESWLALPLDQLPDDIDETANEICLKLTETLEISVVNNISLLVKLNDLMSKPYPCYPIFKDCHTQFHEAIQNIGELDKRNASGSKFVKYLSQYTSSIDSKCGKVKGALLEKIGILQKRYQALQQTTVKKEFDTREDVFLTGITTPLSKKISELVLVTKAIQSITHIRDDLTDVKAKIEAIQSIPEQSQHADFETNKVHVIRDGLTAIESKISALTTSIDQLEAGTYKDKLLQYKSQLRQRFDTWQEKYLALNKLFQAQKQFAQNSAGLLTYVNSVLKFDISSYKKVADLNEGFQELNSSYAGKLQFITSMIEELEGNNQIPNKLTETQSQFLAMLKQQKLKLEEVKVKLEELDKKIQEATQNRDAVFEKLNSISDRVQAIKQSDAQSKSNIDDLDQLQEELDQIQCEDLLEDDNQEFLHKRKIIKDEIRGVHEVISKKFPDQEPIDDRKEKFYRNLVERFNDDHSQSYTCCSCFFPNTSYKKSKVDDLITEDMTSEQQFHNILQYILVTSGKVFQTAGRSRLVLEALCQKQDHEQIKGLKFARSSDEEIRQANFEDAKRKFGAAAAAAA